MKKIVSLVLALVLALSLAACGKTTLTLDKSEHTFTAAGETVQLTADTKADSLSWTSSDESVATVDANGVVTAVAPGTATITIAAGELTATCTVKCDWEINIDLGAFYDELYNELYPLDAEGWPTGPYADDWAALPEMLEGVEMFYPGLTAIETEQMHIYIPMMTAVAYEVALIKVVNESDVEAVKTILQSRIDTQVSNQMNYPMVIEGWQNDARIVSNGKYVMLAVGTDCDAFVDGFNALF